jgi:putative lipoprotein
VNRHSGARLALVRAAAAAVTLLAASRPAHADPPSDPDPWFGPDKALHFGASAAIAGGGYALSAVFFDEYGARAGIGGGLALTAGVTKEALDAAGLGRPSWRDLAWDVLGAAVGVGVALTIDVAVRESGRPAR